MRGARCWAVDEALVPVTGKRRGQRSSIHSLMSARYPTRQAKGT